MTTTIQECCEHGFTWYLDGFCLECGIEYGSRVAANKAHKKQFEAALAALSKREESQRVKTSLSKIPDEKGAGVKMDKKDKKLIDKMLQTHCAGMRDRLHQPMLFRHHVTDYERLFEVTIAEAKDGLALCKELREAQR